MSLLHQYAKVRGFAHRGGDPDEHTAGQTVLSPVLEGRLPYAVPPGPRVRPSREFTSAPTAGR